MHFCLIGLGPIGWAAAAVITVGGVGVAVGRATAGSKDSKESKKATVDKVHFY